MLYVLQYLLFHDINTVFNVEGAGPVHLRYPGPVSTDIPAHSQV